MTIYYTHAYEGNKGESHALLRSAIADYYKDESRAKELIGRIAYLPLRSGGLSGSRELDPAIAGKGKPYIPGFKEFSISHSEHTWAILISESVCGLDVQYERKCNYKSLAERFFDVQDAAGIENVDDFFRTWTRREALVKAMGTSVVAEHIPPVGTEQEIRAGGDTYSLDNLVMLGAPELYAAICIKTDREVERDIDFREIKV